jgi:hypothetical protein
LFVGLVDEYGCESRCFLECDLNSFKFKRSVFEDCSVGIGKFLFSSSNNSKSSIGSFVLTK